MGFLPKFLNSLSHPEFNKPLDPTKAEANERLGLSKEEVAGYSNYHNVAYEKGGHVQTIDEWAKEQKRGIYHEDGYESPALLEATPLKEGETYRAPSTNIATPESPAAEEAKLAAGKPAAAPDLTDETLTAARKAEAQRLKLGQGRASTFLTGPSGVTAAPTLRKKTLLGG